MNLVDLAEKCLQFIPEHRPTMVEILEHPYFREHHDISKEPQTNKRITAEVRHGTMLGIRKEIYKIAAEMNEYREEKYQQANYYERLKNYI